MRVWTMGCGMQRQEVNRVSRQSGIGFLKPNILIFIDEYDVEHRITMPPETMAYLTLQLMGSAIAPWVQGQGVNSYKGGVLKFEVL